MNYYNENNPEAVWWLRELIKQGEIPPGHIDERSIEDVKPHELIGYTQHHFFAGIGGWALALRLAGWPDDQPVRTASCPCQPFSQTGKQLGFADKRHLWPVCRDLLTFGETAITFGEQVASPLGREWLAGVRADLEGLGHEVGSADLCAAGVGAPHLRQRLYWVANRTGKRWDRAAGMQGANGRSILETSRGIGRMVQPNSTGRNAGTSSTTPARHGSAIESASGINRLDHANRNGAERSRSGGQKPDAGCEINGLGHSDSSGPQGRNERIFRCEHQWPVGTPNMVVLCEDGKARRFEPGSFPLAHGIPGRVGLLRGYGNAIVPQLAAQFIQAAVEAIGGMIEPEM